VPSTRVWLRILLVLNWIGKIDSELETENRNTLHIFATLGPFAFIALGHRYFITQRITWLFFHVKLSYSCVSEAFPWCEGVPPPSGYKKAEDLGKVWRYNVLTGMALRWWVSSCFEPVNFVLVHTIFRRVKGETTISLCNRTPAYTVLG